MSVKTQLIVIAAGIVIIVLAVLTVFDSKVIPRFLGRLFAVIGGIAMCAAAFGHGVSVVASVAGGIVFTLTSFLIGQMVSDDYHAAAKVGRRSER